MTDQTVHISNDELEAAVAELAQRAGTNPAPELESKLDPPTQLTDEAKAEVPQEPAAPITPPVLTRKMFKEYLRWHFTVRRSVVKACGHKINLATDPRHNCDSCWFAYFQNNGQMTQIADECFQQAGRDVLERSRGKTFVKYFLRFMSTIARFQREAAEAQKAQEKNNGEANVSGGGSDAEGSLSGHAEGGTGSIGQLAGNGPTIGGIPENGSPIDYVAETEIDSETTA